MGISRDSRHKKRASGGKRKVHIKKRKFELGRPAANTRIGTKRIRLVRCRGGAIKFRALRLETGNFSWGTEAISRKARILNVVYNSSNNELVRTNTLVKGCIVQIDSTPFKQWYRQYYGTQLGKAREEKEETTTTPDKQEKVKKDKKFGRKARAKVAPEAAPIVFGKSEACQTRHAKRREQRNATMDPLLEQSFKIGRLYAFISSSPGQVGRADGYLLEGEDLAFYSRKLTTKKKK